MSNSLPPSNFACCGSVPLFIFLDPQILGIVHGCRVTVRVQQILVVLRKGIDQSLSTISFHVVCVGSNTQILQVNTSIIINCIT